MSTGYGWEHVREAAGGVLSPRPLLLPLHLPAWVLDPQSLLGSPQPPGVRGPYLRHPKMGPRAWPGVRRAEGWAWVGVPSEHWPCGLLVKKPPLFNGLPPLPFYGSAWCLEAQPHRWLSSALQGLVWGPFASGRWPSHLALGVPPPQFCGLTSFPSFSVPSPIPPGFGGLGHFLFLSRPLPVLSEIPSVSVAWP